MAMGEPLNHSLASCTPRRMSFLRNTCLCLVSISDIVPQQQGLAPLGRTQAPQEVSLAVGSTELPRAYSFSASDLRHPAHAGLPHSMLITMGPSKSLESVP